MEGAGWECRFLSRLPACTVYLLRAGANLDDAINGWVSHGILRLRIRSSD